MHRHDLATSRRYVTEQQYANDSNLAARQSIYVYQRPYIDLHRGALDLAQLRGDESVLDIGCGNGRYLEVLRERGQRGLTCGVDLSEGMLRSVQPSIGAGRLMISDAQALPFADDRFDVALSMHMLYHVPDRSLAIAELRRVVRPGGTTLVVTNSQTHLRELDDLLVESAIATVGREQLPARNFFTYKMENGAPELEASFESVTAHWFESELVVDDVAPVVAYARSMSPFVAADADELGVVLDELERRVAAKIAEDGAFRVRTAAGCFVCR